MIEQLVDYEEVSNLDYLEISITNAVFKKDFGVWKRGDSVEILTFNFDNGVLREWSNSGRLVCSVPICVAWDQPE